MDGGIPDGSSLLVAGPSGSGKSIMASQFIAEGLRQSDPGVVAIFEELPAECFSDLDGASLPDYKRSTSVIGLG